MQDDTRVNDGSAVVDEENDGERIPAGGVKTIVDEEDLLDEDSDELDPLDDDSQSEDDDEDEDDDFDAEDDEDE